MLLRKVLRDLRQNFVQFLSIFIMTFFALLIFGGFDADDYSYVVKGADYLMETNFKDMDIQGASFDYTQISMLEEMDEVKSVNGIVRATGKINLDKERPLVISYIDGNDVSKMKVMDGSPYSKGDKGAWLEKRFADPMGIKVGDTITINSDGVSFKEQVKGLVYCPEYAYYIPNSTYTEPEYGTHGFVIMDISEAPYKNVLFNQLIVDLKDVKNQSIYLTEEEDRLMHEMREKITKKLDNKQVIVRTKKEDEVYNTFAGEAEATNAVSTVFSLLFMSVAVLGIITTMTRLTSNQRGQIGTMKALGFSDVKITLHYLSYSVIVTLIACILGAIAGKYTLGAYLVSLDNFYYQCPYFAPNLTYKCSIMTLVAVLICVVTTFVCTRKTLSERAAEILRPAPPKNNSVGFFERSEAWNRLNFGIRWNIRDVVNNKLRTVMSVFGIATTSMLLFAAFGFNECLAAQGGWLYKDLLNTNYAIFFDSGLEQGFVSEYAKEYSGQMVENTEATLYSSTVESVWNATVVDEGNIYRFVDTDLAPISLPDTGVLMTSRLVDFMEVQVGDEIRFRLPGDERTYTTRIVGLCRMPTDAGLVMSRASFEDMGGTFTPNIVYTNMSVPFNLKDKEGIESVNSRAMMIRALESAHEVGYTISTIVIVIGVIVGMIVLYNLGVLSYIEKVREIATMKVLGFSSKNIRLILMQQNLTITALGAIIGVPMGRATLDVLLDAFLMEESDTLTLLSFMPFIASVVGTFLVSAIINTIVTSKVKDIDMVEALKGVE